MRLTLHRLVLSSLALTSLFLIYLGLYHGSISISPDNSVHGSSILSPPIEGLNAVVNATYLNSARRFWHPWARIIYDAKPTIPTIEIQGSGAGNIGKSEGGSDFREEYTAIIELSNENVQSLHAAHAKMRSALDAYNTIAVAQDMERLFKGRGIVTVVGGEYFGPAIVGIRLLRQAGSTLPIEVFLPNWEEYEPELCEKVLPDLNAQCVVLTQVLDLPNQDEDKALHFSITHYQLKSLAILFSRFREVLLLDSDCILLINPEELFSAEPFKSTGFVGWPDFWIGTEAPVFYQIAGLNGFPKDLPATSSEAGQLIVDKSKHIKTLLLAAYYNIWGPGWYYVMLSQGALGQGDKNTFETAAVVLNLPYYRVKTPVKSVGRMTGNVFKGSGMVQFHPTDDYATDHTSNKTVRPAFIHANTPKMNPGHLVDEGDLQDEITKEHLRLWGTKQDQDLLFGTDFEKSTFQVVVDVGCELANVVREWKHRWKVCSRLKQHFKETFE
jgi:alpha 1,2-mannosyltransferase